MIERKFRERAAKAMFPQLRWDAPVWTDFVLKGQWDPKAPLVRVAQSMQELDAEVRAEFDPLVRETADTIPPGEWVPAEGDTVRVKSGRYTGVRGRIERLSRIAGESAIVTLFKCSMLPSDIQETMSVAQLERWP